jgi:hypothetical protein
MNATGCWVSDQELATSLIASALASELQDGDLMADTMDGEHACSWGPLPRGADDRRLSLNPRGLVEMDIEVDDLWRMTAQLASLNVTPRNATLIARTFRRSFPSRLRGKFAVIDHRRTSMSLGRMVHPHDNVERVPRIYPVCGMAGRGPMWRRPIGPRLEYFGVVSTSC